MGQAKQRASRKKQFFQEHPFCCFCGGTAPTTSIDHVPPRACFPEGHVPEGFEFPACEGCNQGTRTSDQVFGFYAQLADFDGANYNSATIDKLLQGIINNNRDALPSLVLSANRKRAALRRMGVRNMPGGPVNAVPLINVPPAFNEAAITIGRKLACALNYRERGKIVPGSYKITVGWNQLQNKSHESVIRFLSDLLPDQTIGTRTNIKKYGQRFVYKSGVKDENDDDFFIYAAQFGTGLVVWRVVMPPSMEISDPLASMTHTVFGPHT